jgi:hypothetical protein
MNHIISDQALTFARSFRNIQIPMKIIHSTSCFNYQGLYHCIKINNFSPKSKPDWLMLNWTRALSNVILISGKVLRDEPNLKCVVAPEFKNVFHENLSSKLFGVLTNDPRIFQMNHHFFSVNARKYLIFTKNIDLLKIVNEFSASKGIHMECVLISKIEDALEWFRSQFPSLTVSIEAGPNVTNDLLYSESFQFLPHMIILNEFELDDSDSNADFRNNCLGGKTIPKAILTKYYKRISYFKENQWKYQIFCKVAE